MSSNDSGVDAGSDSNESVSMSVGSSLLSDRENSEDNANNHLLANEVVADVHFQEQGAVGGEDALAFTSFSFGEMPHCLNTSSFSNTTEDQHDFCPKLKFRATNRRWQRWAISHEIEEKKLRLAANQNQIEVVHSLLNKGVNPKASDGRQRTALHFAACKGNVEIVRLLLEHGADVNQKDVVGNTALHLAVCTNHIPVITLLLKAGTDINAIDNSGRTPLHLAKSKLRLLKDCSYSSSQMKQEILEIINMMQIYLQRSGKMVEVDLWTKMVEVTNRLHLRNTKEEVDKDVEDLLSSISHLSIDL
ncbi:Ankyrin repeat domain-containing protein 54-like protein [Dinothrombium tinctorium]|uniref:Ankyrin repeat domain-containing protein 54-like protein n=1 Tax=Dinothrombium tinctorium TaxID=1965070 RepID=A0A3S3NZE7_9ACAR|nr:Ankyrin repeat domain-containing protein 54-like protein [Dinothrombium tinctorium]